MITSLTKRSRKSGCGIHVGATSRRTNYNGLGKVVMLLLCVYASLVWAADNLLPNGGCEEQVQKNGVAYPKHVGSGQHSGSQGRWCLDAETFHAGKASAFLEKTNPPGWCDLSFATPEFPPLEETREVEIKLWLKAEECRIGQIVLMGADAIHHQALWHTLHTYKGSFDWTERTIRTLVPPGIRRLTISVRLSNGSGKLWVDDVSLRWIASDHPLLYNADFEAGAQPGKTIPVCWEEREFEGFEANCAISLTEGQSSRNAVQLTWKSGGSRFGVQTPLTRVAPKRRHACSIMFKSDNGCPGGCLAEFFDAQRKLVGALESPAFKAAKSGEWSPQCFAFQVPEGCAFMRIVLLLGGEGAVCYDNVKLLAGEEAIQATFPLQATCRSIDCSKIWNNGQAVFHTFADSPASFTISFKGDQALLKNPTLVVEVPDWLEIAQCFEAHTDFGNPVPAETTPLKRNGEDYTRYAFRKANVWTQIKTGWAWHRDLTMAFLPRQISTAPRSCQAYWHMENDGESDVERAFTLVVLPPLPSLPIPKRLRGGYWNRNSYDFPDKELFLKVIRHQEQCGMTIRTRNADRKEFDAMLKGRGWIMVTGVPCIDYGLRFGIPDDIIGADKIKGKIPPRILDGKPDTQKLCPEYFLHDPDYALFARNYVQDRIVRRGYEPGEILNMDTEPWSPTKWCQCERCREAFARFAGLPETPDMTRILTEMPDEWIRFRCQQVVDTFARYHEYIREAFPTAVLLDYDYLMPFHDQDALRSHLRGVSKDTARTEQYFDGHIQSMYHLFNARGFDYVQVNRRALKKDYQIILAIDPPGSYLQPFEVLSPKLFALNVMATAALGSTSWWIYSDSDTDGAYFVEIQRAMADIARLEECFAIPETDGFVAVAGAGPAFTADNHVRFAARRLHDGRILLSLFNFSSAPSQVAIRLTDNELAAARDALDDTPCNVTDAALPCTIPPESAKHLFLK